MNDSAQITGQQTADLELDQLSRDMRNALLRLWPSVKGELIFNRAVRVSIDYLHKGDWFEDTHVRFLDSAGQTVDLGAQLMHPIDRYEHTMLTWLYVRLAARGGGGGPYGNVVWTLCDDPLSPNDGEQ
jgi:hypothetical protein